MADEPPFSAVIALLTFSRVWEAQLADALKPLGLTTRKYGLLGHIKSSPGISFSELARRSRITVQSAHTAVAGFFADDLVEDATAHAGASSSLRVTPRGEQLLAQAAEIVTELDAALSERMPQLSEALGEEFRRRVR